MGLYTTSAADLEATGFRQTDIVTDARPGRGDREYVVLSIDLDTRTVRACPVTAGGRPGRKVRVFQPEDLRLVYRAAN